jgi:hypothetical protein
VANLWKGTCSYVMCVCLSVSVQQPSCCAGCEIFVDWKMWREFRFGLIVAWRARKICGTSLNSSRLNEVSIKVVQEMKSSRWQIQFFPQSCVYEVATGKAKSMWSYCVNVNLLQCDMIIQSLCVHEVLSRACGVTCCLIQTKHCSQTQLFNTRICHQCCILRLNEPSADITMQK